MAKDFTTKFKFTGDADGVERATGQAAGSFDGLSKKLTVAAAGIAGAMATAFAVDKIVGWGKDLYDIGNQAELWNKKAGIVFGDQIGVMEDWASGAAGAMGLTKSELLGASAAMGDLLVPMGATREQAATMSRDIMGLSGALSAWSGGTRSAAEVSDILAKALLGETDGLKGLGIAISAAEVQERALAVARADGREAVTQMDEALASQQLILEKSTDAQTAWSDGTFAAQQKQAELSAKIDEVKEKLGSALLPAVQAFTAWLVDSAIPALESFKEWIWPKLQSAFDNLSGWWDEHGPGIVGFVTGIKDAAIEMGEGIASTWDDTISPAIDDMKAAFEELGTKLGELTSTTSEELGIQGVDWQTLGKIAGYTMTAMIFNMTMVARGATAMLIGVQLALFPMVVSFNAAKTALEAIKTAWDKLKEAFRLGISVPKINWPNPPGWLSSITGAVTGAVPRKRHSGTFQVPGAPGSNVPAILQAGEVVMSKGQVRANDRTGGSGMSIIVNAYGATGREMVAEIERAVRDGARAGWLQTAGVTP